MYELAKMSSFVESSDDLSSATVSSSSDSISEHLSTFEFSWVKPDENNNEPQLDWTESTVQKLSISELAKILLDEEDYDFNDESTSCMFCISHVQQAYQVANLFQSSHSNANDNYKNPESPLKFFYESSGDDTSVMIAASKLHSLLQHQNYQSNSQPREPQVQHSSSPLVEISKYLTLDDDDNENLFVDLPDTIDTSSFCKTDFFVQDSMPSPPIDHVSVSNSLTEPLFDMNAYNGEDCQDCPPKPLLALWIKSDTFDQSLEWPSNTEVHPSQPDQPECSSNNLSTYEDYYIRSSYTSKHPLNQNIGPNGNPQHVCPIPGCGKNLASVKSLNVHLKRHSGTVNFICAYCKNGFMYKNNLRAHIIKHMASLKVEIRRKCKCPNCIVDRGNQTGDPNGKHLCHIAGCGRIFSYPTNLIRHLDRHYGKKNFFCEYCHKGFVLKSGLDKHLKIHTNFVESNAEILPKKIRPPQACRISGCEEIRYSTRALRKHLMLDHLVKPYKCTWPSCGKSFLYKYNFLLHEKNHSVEKKFICSYCDKRFRRVVNRDIHVHSKHGNSKFENMEL